MQKIIIGVAILCVVLVGGFVFLASPKPADPKIKVLAQCLKDKGTTMYGAAWCPHCQRQKALFGEAFSLIPYVECPNEAKLCLDKGVTGYPTWITASGKHLEGEQDFKTLAKESGCTF